MPKPYPQEFRDDVVKVARRPPQGTTLEQVTNRLVPPAGALAASPAPLVLPAGPPPPSR